MTRTELRDAVVVVTGASSGIGRGTALALADHGAHVVLAARSAGVLEDVARDCERRGVRALAVPTDVAEADQVEALGKAAVAEFGGFDVWINDAAVMAFGSFWEVPTEAYRRVVEVNLFGTVHGSRVAIDHFRERGRGVLINVGSLYGRVTTPYVNPYVVSKYAVRGLTHSLRQETRELGDVRVCSVLPQAVDTPIFRQAANYTGQQLTALPLVVDPQRVVRAILRCVSKPRSEVIVGVFGHLLAWGRALLPGAYSTAAPRVMDELAIGDEPAPHSDGNVFEPRPEGNAVEGGWRRRRRRLRRAAAVGAATAAVGLLSAARRLARRVGG